MFAKFLQETSEQQHAAGSFFFAAVRLSGPWVRRISGTGTDPSVEVFFWNISIIDIAGSYCTL